jgi:L-alanine-DL-glutamate epimerase-like enolase superfamily enzyme
VRALPPAPPDAPAADWLHEIGALLPPTVPAAAFALETAFLDWVGRTRGRSMAEILRPEGRQRDVRLAALMQGRTKEEIAAEARAAFARGLDTIKVKIGRPGGFGEELEILHGLREDLGDRFALRLDGNGAWDLAEAEERLPALVAARPEFVEQPVVPYLLLKLGGSPLPIAADETLLFPGAAERLSAVRAVTVWVLKPMALGGIARCLAIAKIAKARKIGVLVSHLFDGPVALAAAAELALALPAMPLACGLDRHAGLSVWPDASVPQIEGGRIRPSGAAGHGVVLSEENR